MCTRDPGPSEGFSGSLLFPNPLPRRPPGSGVLALTALTGRLLRHSVAPWVLPTAAEERWLRRVAPGGRLAPERPPPSGTRWRPRSATRTPTKSMGFLIACGIRTVSVHAPKRYQRYRIGMLGYPRFQGRPPFPRPPSLVSSHRTNGTPNPDTQYTNYERGDL